jgi:hypothetical protein
MKSGSQGFSGKKAMNAMIEFDQLCEVNNSEPDIDEVIEEAVAESAKPIYEDIKKWAEKHKLSGDTLEGLEMTPVKNASGNIYLWLGIDSKKNKNAWHAVFVEYGTPRNAADPGITNAFKRNRAKIKKIQEEVIKRRGGLL